MLTKKDIQLLEKHFATKQELAEMKKEILEIIRDVYTSLKREIDDLREELYEVKKELKNDILQFKDEILFEIKAMRENSSVYEYRQRQHSDQLENHEKRIYLLEKPDRPY